DLSGGTGDARIVHEAVEAAQAGDAVLEEVRHLLPRRHVAGGAADVRIALREPRERELVGIADLDLRALAHEGARDLEADARRTRAHHHAQPFHLHVHAFLRAWAAAV